MSASSISRRHWMAWVSMGAAASFGTLNATANAMSGEAALTALAEKVLKELPHDLVVECIRRIADQIAQCTTSTPMETVAQLLHADDMAFGRTVEIQGIDFSRAQIGLLALVAQHGTNR